MPSHFPVPQLASPLLVRQSPFFASLPEALTQEVAQHFHLTTWKKDTYIDSDKLMTEFYFLLEGQLEMKRNNPDTGREVTLDMLYPGDSFDIMVLLDGKSHDVLFSPVSSLQLVSVPMEMMRKWIWTYPELNQKFLPYLAKKMRDQEDQASSFVLHDITTRLSRLILKHINKIQSYTGTKEDEQKSHLINGLSDEILARMIGSVRQVVNKQLQFWHSQGIINKKRNQIIIKDLDAIYKEARIIQSSMKQDSK
ncbi:MAG: Crp/Fnr family transcriptional regulator [Gammaproteobacteria bacterium]|nr:Crp/Fnr family transcriptional regulator [Gammaproteobacteria bacterium]